MSAWGSGTWVGGFGGGGTLDLDQVIETTGTTTLTVRQALQLAAALAVGRISGIGAGRNNQVFALESATGAPIATVTGDALGNRAVSWDTP